MSEIAVNPVAAPSGAPALARRLGLFTLVVYGVGDMIGSGIYGTIGQAAAHMGNAVWLAFVASMVAAMLTGLSYASLASRYPRAGGAAFITQRAYRLAFLSYVVGLTVTASGLTSMATNSSVFSDVLASFTSGVPALSWIRPWMILLAFIGVMTCINLLGIRESMWANVVCTAIEVGGLVFIIIVGARYWGSVDYLETPAAGVAGGAAAIGAGAGGGLDLWLLGSGAVLTFFSFVGFEDMLNVAEEVKRPQRTMPLGIVTALLVTSVLYVLVAITAVSVVPHQELADVSRGAPLQQITNHAAPWLPRWVYGFITLFAVANSVLINYVMGSRMLYGMSRQRLLPGFLGRVNRSRQTPHAAIFTLMVVVIALSFVGGISQLASATSLLLLMVFCIVNAALIVLKRRPGEARGRFEVPLIVPALGVLACAGLIAARISRVIAEGGAGWRAPAIAAGLVAFISVLYLLMRPKPLEDEAYAELG